MILYIHFTNLSGFETLFNKNKDLQDMVERSTGIKWLIKKGADTGLIEKILKAENIKYDIANGKG